MSGSVHFQLEGTAGELCVAPPSDEAATFRRGDVEVVLEQEFQDGRETENCRLIARTTRQVSENAYQGFEDRFVSLLSEDQSQGRSSASGARVLSASELNWLMRPPESVLAICEDVFS